MSTNSFSNIAFISYKREDEKWAKWLQYKLEHYRLPSEILKKNPNIEFSRKPRHVFKDTTDLSGGLLEEEIRKALDSSKYLIVICSPRASQSPWVSKEVQHFIDIGREEYIIPFIIDGEPNAKEASKECFPNEIKNLKGKKEILGININENGRDAAAVKTIARMFDLRFDILWQRFQREERRKGFTIIFISAIVVLIGIIMGYYLYSQNRTILKNQSKILGNQASKMVDNGYPFAAGLLALELFNGKYPYTIEAEIALRKAYNCEIATINENVYSLAISPDGKYIASVGRDSLYSIVKIWDANTGTCINTLKKQYENINSVAFSPNGKYIASGSWSGTKIWDTNTGMCIITLGDQYEDINSIAFSPNGKYIASGGWNGIKIWDANTGTCINTLKKQSGNINSVAFSPNGKYIVGSFNNIIKIWDTNTGKCINTLKGHREKILSISFSPNGKYIASGSFDNTIKIWDVNFGRCLKTIHSNTGDLVSVSFSPSGNQIVSGCIDNTVKIWNLSGECISSYSVNKNKSSRFYNPHSTIFSPNGNQIVFFIDNAIKIWNINRYKNFYQCSYSISEKLFDFSRDGKSFVLIAQDENFSHIKFLDINTGKELNRINISDNIKCIDLSPNDELLVYGNYTGDIKLINLRTGECTSHLIGHDGPIFSVYFNPNGKLIASTSIFDGTTKIWDIETRKCIKSFNLQKERINNLPKRGLNIVAFSPNGNLIALCTSGDNIIKIWDFITEKYLKSINVHQKISSITFSPNGDLIASSGSDGIINIWDINTNECIRRLSGHTDHIASVKFSKDGTYLVSGGYDEIKIWHVNTGKSVESIDLNGAKYIDFNPVGTQIAFGDFDGMVKIWKFQNLDTIIEHMRERFKDITLTDAQRSELGIN